VLERTESLAAVPAPTFAEERWARLVGEWWREDGLEVRVDEAGNVWGMLRPGAGHGVVVCAHLDTVFDESVDHRPLRDGGRLYGPGVGDDTVAVAALSALDRLLPAKVGAPVWIVATVAKEGLGDLAGTRHAVARPPGPIGWMIAVEVGNRFYSRWEWRGRVRVAGGRVTKPDRRAVAGGPARSAGPQFRWPQVRSHVDSSQVSTDRQEFSFLSYGFD
jgi:hypothetical protein